MNKFVRITVSASLSTDFYLEVPEDATEVDIRRLAEQEVTLPHHYPDVVDKALQKIGIKVDGLDSMLRDWNIDETEYLIDEDFTD